MAMSFGAQLIENAVFPARGYVGPRKREGVGCSGGYELSGARRKFPYNKNHFKRSKN
jgi:hypothetical protein